MHVIYVSRYMSSSAKITFIVLDVFNRAIREQYRINRTSLTFFFYLSLSHLFRVRRKGKIFLYSKSVQKNQTEHHQLCSKIKFVAKHFCITPLTCCICRFTRNRYTIFLKQTYIQSKPLAANSSDSPFSISLK